MNDTQTDTLTKKEQNEVNREERQKAQEKAMRVRKIKKLLPWITILIVVIGAIYWAITASQKSSAAKPGESISIVSREHINLGDSHEGYNSNPPTSGPHSGPAPWGFSEQEVADENAVHNLEHGGIWISYKDLDGNQVAQLEKIAKANSLSVLVSPRNSNDSKISVASWGRLMKLDYVDEDQINNFIRENKNKSPEPLAR